MRLPRTSTKKVCVGGRGADGLVSPNFREYLWDMVLAEGERIPAGRLVSGLLGSSFLAVVSWVKGFHQDWMVGWVDQRVLCGALWTWL